jgi:threonine aldolase
LALKVIDLRSDTVTHPTDDMRRAMSEAAVGDDVYGEDPTVNELEQTAARIVNKEAALFTASGTMSNLIAVLAQTRRGDEIIVGSEAHLFWYEVGGASALGGVTLRTVPNEWDGSMAMSAVEDAIRSRNIHYPPTTLLCLENTHNRCGGAVLSAQYTADAVRLAHDRGIRLHLDGARIFNASVALGIPVADLTAGVDSVSFCLSKGLSAPVGSMLCGDRGFVETARKWRKMVGGGMRQAGVLAAAGIVALRSQVGRLVEDHLNASRLSQGLAGIPGIVGLVSSPTNIVMFEVGPTVSGIEFLGAMDSQGVRLSHRGGQRFRAVTHRMISPGDVDSAIDQIGRFLSSRR